MSILLIINELYVKDYIGSSFLKVTVITFTFYIVEKKDELCEGNVDKQMSFVVKIVYKSPVKVENRNWYSFS